jgi:hypothetical protein
MDMISDTQPERPTLKGWIPGQHDPGAPEIPARATKPKRLSWRARSTLGSTAYERHPPASQLAGGTFGLMLGYCDAIEECRGLPVLSIWPFVRLIFKAYMWGLALDLGLILLLPDIILFTCRMTFGLPKLVLGRKVYNYLARPFRSAWAGEIPWFRIVRIRYLTRLLLCYYARRKNHILQDTLNRSQLQMLARSSDTAALSESEKLQKAMKLLDKITESRLKIGPIVALGPIVSLFSVVTQKVILPGLHNTLDYFLVKFGVSGLGPSALLIDRLTQNTLIFGVLAVLFAIWILASAWMDKRAILTKLGVPQLERSAFGSVHEILPPELPLDIIALTIVSVGFISLPIWLDVYSLLVPSGDMPQGAQQTEVRTLAIEYLVLGAGFCLVALSRRVYLSRSKRPLVTAEPLPSVP